MGQFIRYLSQFSLTILLFAGFSPAFAAEIAAVNFEGSPIGQVISTGLVINADGENIGYITADSLIMDEENNVIGGVVPQGIAIGLDNRLLGKIHNDGKVRSLNGNEIGSVLPSGLVINSGSEVIGAVLYPGLVYSSDGRTIGRLTGAGVYTNLEGQEVGFVSANGYAYRKSGDSYVLDGRLLSAKMVVALDGRFIGSLSPSGKVADFEGKDVGTIHANGYVYDASGSIIGGLVSSGYAFDMNGQYMGIVSYNGVLMHGDRIMGHYRPDGNIVNDKNEVIGYAVAMNATATDERGRYLGRLVAGGNITHGGKSVGHLGARGYVYDDNDAIIGRLIETGPVFDVLGNLKGQLMPNGSLVSLGGNQIGYARGREAYDSNGTLIGATVQKMIAVDNNNRALGAVEFDATVRNGEEVQKVSPFGYLLNNENKIVGSSLNMSAVYGLEGMSYSYIGVNGNLDRSGSDALLAPNGTLFSKDGWLGEVINPLYALSFNGNPLGMFTQSNLLQNKDGNITHKIVPGNYVINSSADVNASIAPISGFSNHKNIALSISGDLIGYASADGLVRDLNGKTVGRTIYRDYILDNNGVINGQQISYAVVNNDKCGIIGAVNGRGDIINNRDVLIGRLLPNGQAISDVGSYVGYSTFQKGLIDFNGHFVGTVNSGQGVDFEGRILGCVNRYGQINDAENKIRYGVITLNPVMNFESAIIGHVMANGQVVDSQSKFLGYIQPNGNVVSKSKKDLGHVFKYAVAYDNSNKFLGMVQDSGQVLNSEGAVVGEVRFDGSVIFDDENIGYALYDFYVYDENFATYGYLTKDGTVLSAVGSRLGKIDRGFVLDRNNNIIARGNRDYIVRDINDAPVGELRADGQVFDFEGKNIGTLEKDTGSIKDETGEEIARATSLQYYVTPNEQPGKTADWADTGRVQKDLTAPKPKAPSNVLDDGEPQEGYGRRIVGIALSPDGDVIGNIYDDDTVKNENGEQIGYRTPDGIVVDMNYDPIGVEEIKRAATNNMFVPANAFGKGNAYGIGSQPSNLGPGGGYGQGERYDPVREQALAQLQARRRGDIAVGKIESGISVSTFTGYEEDGWPGVRRNISSWRVDMSQMILEDKPIPAVLARSVYASDGFSDNIPITAIVERNIYAEEGRNIIIPAGSRVIGRLGGGATGGNSGGAVKIGISWKRLIRPDGSQFIFSNANTADAQGRAGAIGYLDEQLLKRYAMPLLSTALESGIAYVMASGKGSKSTDTSTTTGARTQAAEDARQNFISQMNTIFEDIMQRKANIRSVTYVPAGTRIIIFPNEDMWLNDDKRAKEREITISNKRTEINAPLVNEYNGSNPNNEVTYSGNYRENVQPVSAAKRAPRQTGNTLVEDSRNSSNRQVPPATIQQPAPAKSSSNNSNNSNNDDDVPDLGI